MFSSSKHEKGQGLVEYALIIVLVSIVVIAALIVLGPRIGNTFNNISSTLGTVTTAGGGSGSTTTTLTGCPAVHPDGYATGSGYGWDCYSPTYGAYNIH